MSYWFILLSHDFLLKCVSVNYACLACYFVMRLMVLLFIFIHMHLASHLGTLDEPREGRVVGAEPEDSAS